MILNETCALHGGAAIPRLGLGTWMIDDDRAAQAVREAVKLGYRLIDTAQAYGKRARRGRGRAHLRRAAGGAVRGQQGGRGAEELRCGGKVHQ